MAFRDSIKENIWFGLLSYEYERHVRDLFQQGMAEAWLTFDGLQEAKDEDKHNYLREQSTPFVCLCVRQSKELFVAAEQASDATKPLLSYYGMMNLVKGLLALDRPDFFENKSNLHHGLSVREGAKGNLNFQEEAVILMPRGIAALGRESLGKSPACSPKELVLVKDLDLLKGLPDLYWDYQKLARASPREMNTFPIGFPDTTKFEDYSQQFYVDTYADRAVFNEVKERLTVDLAQHFIIEESGNSLHLKSRLKSKVIQDLINHLNEFSTMLLQLNSRFIPLRFNCVIGAARGFKD